MSSVATLDALDDLAADPGCLEAMMGLGREVDRKLACHPHATQDMLRTLAGSPDRGTRRLVALNPEAPKDLLLALAPAFPGEFLLNPCFDLLLLEDPNLLQGLPASVLKNILKRADCPRSLLRWAAFCGSGPIRAAVAGRQDVPVELLQVIAAGPYVKAAELAASRLMTGT
ncbi:MAG: hypothetical protein L6Q73_19500 [Aquabacterium sp.]|nr:hypothetical protein [Aquabacterium sp.]